MTVKELMEKLEKCDPEAICITYNEYYGGFFEIREIKGETKTRYYSKYFHDDAKIAEKAVIFKG